MLFIFLCIAFVSASKPCVPKYFENSNVPAKHRMSCECNATYCDSIGRLPVLALGEYVVYTSNIDGLRMRKTRGTFEELQRPMHVEMTINFTEQYHSILGFGSSFTDAAGININSLSPQAQNNLLRAYFSEDGIELNMARVPIAGTDFSTRAYTYDDVANDTELAHFNLTSEDYQLKIPHIKRAMKLSTRKISFVAAAWTAPVWMKNKDDFSGGYLYNIFYSIWADYHIKFLDAYHKEGIDFWGLSTGNEPLNGVWPVYEFNAMGWLPMTQFKWVRENLGPALRNSEHNQIKIMTSDDQRFMVPVWSYALTQDTLAASFIDGFAVHWYLDFFWPASLFNSVHSEFPNKFILATEAATGTLPWEDSLIPGSWERGVLYFKDIMEDLNHWVGGWIDWNMALSQTGGPTWSGNTVDAAIIVNADEDTFYKQPMFYALGHFSKFITEGSVRVGITQPSKSGVQSVAFQTLDDQAVVVILNENAEKIPVTIKDPSLGNINLELTGNSFQTIVYPKKIIMTF